MICQKSDPESKEICIRFLLEKKILILPADTVYGFSGIVKETEDKIRNIKGRAENKPFIQLIAAPEDIKNITNDTIPKKILSFWPGALTVIVRSKDNPLFTLAVRCPGDEWLRNIIAGTGHPVYSTSVNKSGFPILESINEIKKEFEDKVDLIIDGGDKKNSIPSTIVKIEGESIFTIRQGRVYLD